LWRSHKQGRYYTTSQVEFNHEYVECFAKDKSVVNFMPIVNIEPEGNYKDKKDSFAQLPFEIYELAT